MAEFRITASARQDLDEIWAFVAKDNLMAADALEADFFKSMEAIAHYPMQGHQRPDLTSAQVLFWSIRRYYIVYDPACKPLQILRILSGYRDITKLV